MRYLFERDKIEFFAAVVEKTVYIFGNNLRLTSECLLAPHPVISVLCLAFRRAASSGTPTCCKSPHAICRTKTASS